MAPRAQTSKVHTSPDFGEMTAEQLKEFIKTQDVQLRRHDEKLKKAEKALIAEERRVDNLKTQPQNLRSKGADATAKAEARLTERQKNVRDQSAERQKLLALLRAARTFQRVNFGSGYSSLTELQDNSSRDGSPTGQAGTAENSAALPSGGVAPSSSAASHGDEQPQALTSPRSGPADAVRVSSPTSGEKSQEDGSEAAGPPNTGLGIDPPSGKSVASTAPHSQPSLHPAAESQAQLNGGTLAETPSLASTPLECQSSVHPAAESQAQLDGVTFAENPSSPHMPPSAIIFHPESGGTHAPEDLTVVPLNIHAGVHLDADKVSANGADPMLPASAATPNPPPISGSLAGLTSSDSINGPSCKGKEKEVTTSDDCDAPADRGGGTLEPENGSVKPSLFPISLATTQNPPVHPWVAEMARVLPRGPTLDTQFAPFLTGNEILPNFDIGSGSSPMKLWSVGDIPGYDRGMILYQNPTSEQRDALTNVGDFRETKSAGWSVATGYPLMKTHHEGDGDVDMTDANLLGAQWGSAQMQTNKRKDQDMDLNTPNEGGSKKPKKISSRSKEPTRVRTNVKGKGKRARRELDLAQIQLGNGRSEVQALWQELEKDKEVSDEESEESTDDPDASGESDEEIDYEKVPDYVPPTDNKELSERLDAQIEDGKRLPGETERAHDIRRSRMPEWRAAAITQIVAFHRGQILHIDRVVKKLCRTIADFVPMSGTGSAALTEEILCTDEGAMRCPFHCMNKKKTDVFDGDGGHKKRGYYFTGVSGPGTKSTKTAPTTPPDGRLHCGCDRNLVLLEFFFWKTQKISGTIKGRPSGRKEGWEGRMDPRTRKLIYGAFTEWTGLTVDDLWDRAPDEITGHMTAKVKASSRIDAQIARLQMMSMNLKAEGK